MKKNILYLVLLCFVIFSCDTKSNETKTINGLWLVTKVKIGKEENTPVARWMQFNKDSTQTSGNGWLKHSEGVYRLNLKNQLTIINSNGILDEANPFSIDLKENTMTWSRIEEGQNVEVFLEKIDEKPTSSGNKLMGLWKLESYKISDKDVTAKENPNNNQTLYLSWDNVYREHNLVSGRKVGIYKIHGHKPELQMVNYGKDPAFSFWKFSFENDELILRSTDHKIMKKYRRIYKFLQ